jgi:hypothetical protein
LYVTPILSEFSSKFLTVVREVRDIVRITMIGKSGETAAMYITFKGII